MSKRYRAIVKTLSFVCFAVSVLSLVACGVGVKPDPSPGGNSPATSSDGTADTAGSPADTSSGVGQGEAKPSETPVAAETGGASSSQCVVDGKTYNDGERFGYLCNSCVCRKGSRHCTKMACGARICYEAPDSGLPCKAFLTVWSYDKTTMKCVKRGGYGGCGKSRNVFQSEEECVKKCR